MVGDALRMVAVGILIGVPAAYVIGRALDRLLFGLEPFDLPTASGALVTLTAIAGLAALLPAQRAARVNLGPRSWSYFKGPTTTFRPVGTHQRKNMAGLFQLGTTLSCMFEACLRGNMTPVGCGSFWQRQLMPMSESARSRGL
jgi:hypothetical protein